MAVKVMQSNIISFLFVSVLAVVVQGSSYTLSHSRPQNNSIIWLDEEVTTVISCQFTPSSATGTVIIGWFLNGEEIAFNGEPQFPGVAFSVEDYQHKMNIISSTLTVMLAASVDEENLIYLNNGRITCFPPGNNDGRAFGMFTTFVSRNIFFQLPEYTVSEDAEIVSVCISTNESIRDPINLITRDDSATAGEDYVAISQPHSLLPENTCVNISLLPDNMLEGNELFHVDLYRGTLDTEILLATVTVTIIDSFTTVDPTVSMKVMFEESSYTVLESNKFVTVCLFNMDPVTTSILVNLTTIDNTSVAGEDYEGLMSYSLTLESADRTCVNMSIIFDDKLEGLELFLVRADSSDGSTVTTVTIIDSKADICSNGDVKLVTKEVLNLVLICDGGGYIPVCHDGWDNLDAAVVCQQTNHTQFSIAVLSSGIATQERAITNMTCVGTETHASKCVYSTTNQTCQQAAVECNHTSPCLKPNFWCPESSHHDPLCVPRDRVCDGSNDCPYSHADEGLCTGHREGDVRLIYLSETEFIVKIYSGNSYRQVCRDTWDHREASVVCRQLNVSQVGVITFIPQIATNDLELDTRFVNDIFCFGNEASIGDCRKIDDSACSSFETVIVTCQDSDKCNDGEWRVVQVKSGDGGVEGRLEVCFNNLWGTASMIQSSSSVAGVICKHLGYEASEAVYQYPARPHPDIHLLPIIWPVYINCDAPNSTLNNCSIERLTEDIRSPPQAFVAGFQCRAFFRDNCTEGEIRISKIFSLYESNIGVPEVCQNNSWNKLHGVNFSNSVASVMCRQLGFYGGHFLSVSHELWFSSPLPTTTPRWTCRGNERHLEECEDLSLSPNATYVEGSESSYIGINCTGLPTLFLHSPSESLMDRDTFVVKEGKNFELDCSTGRPSDILTLKQNGILIKTDSGSVSIMQSITESDAGNYTCGFVTAENFTAERHFRMIVNSTKGERSSSTFRLSVPSTESESIESISQVVLALISRECDGVQDVECSLVEENTRQEDIERELSRIECVVLSYHPVGDLNAIVNSVIKVLPKLSPMFLYLSLAGKGFCNAEMNNDVSWPETPSGGAVVTGCPENENRNMTCHCIDATWSKADYDTCLSFHDIPVVKEDNVVIVVRQLKLVVTRAPVDEQNEANARLIADLLEQIAAILREEGTRLSTENMTEIVSNVVEIMDTLLAWDPEIIGKYGSRNVNNFESILVSLITSQDFEHQGVVADNMALLTRTVMDNTEVSFVISSFNEQFETTDGISGDGGDVATISAPPFFNAPQVTLDQGPLTVAVAVYEEPAFFPLPEEDVGLEMRVGTPVVSLLVARDREQIEVDNLDPPIVLNLSITQINPENVSHAHCAFWDFTTEKWSTDGCKTQVSDDKSRIICICTHLTNFAALVDVCRRTEGCETSAKAEFALSVLSIVGVTLSLMGLLVTIFTMLLFKTLRKREISKFHIQLCIAMFCMLIVFLAGIERTSVKGGCVTVAVLIHYFTLVSVMWMGAEAVLMFQKLVFVFVRITKRYIIIVSLICWLAPLLPVIISVAIEPDHVIIKEDDGSPALCFIGNTATFFAAFLGPVLAIVLSNCVLFIIVVTVLIQHKWRSKLGGMKMKKSGGRDSSLRLMISIACIISLFGLTWVFGALTVDKASLAFQVIFVILNSLQGFFIFLFLCVLGRDARELWLEVLFCGRYKSSYLHPSSFPTSTAEKKASSDLLATNTTAQTIEKSIPTASVTYSINYVEFSEKADMSSESNSITSGSDTIDKSTPEPTATEFEMKEKDSENQANGSANATVNGDGHLLRSMQPEKHDELLDMSKGDSQPDVHISRYSTLKGNHHVERFELEFHN